MIVDWKTNAWPNRFSINNQKSSINNSYLLLSSQKKNRSLRRGFAVDGRPCAERRGQIGDQQIGCIVAVGSDSSGCSVDDGHGTTIAQAGIHAAAVCGGGGEHAEARRGWRPGENRCAKCSRRHCIGI